MAPTYAILSIQEEAHEVKVQLDQVVMIEREGERLHHELHQSFEQDGQLAGLLKLFAGSLLSNVEVKHLAFVCTLARQELTVA